MATHTDSGPFPITQVDRAFYRDHLADFLPDRMVDTHTHIWLDAFRQPPEVAPRGPTWPGRVARENSVEELLASYPLLFPGKRVTPVVFGAATRSFHLEDNNAYVSEAARRHRLPALMVTDPAWSAQELERRVVDGGFIGLKPYLEFAPGHIPSDDIAICDFLPPHHLEVADAHGWIVVLHIPRRMRLRDPLNLRQMLEIERMYSRLQLVIAHIGRAYCLPDIGDAFDVLRDTQRMSFDISANTNGDVMARLLQAVGPGRVVFGSDLPVVRMRMRRICEGGFYVNLVPRGLYGDVSDDPHMREVSDDEGRRLSFFMYEELYAFRRAAEATGLSREQVADVLCHNAERLVTRAGGSIR